MITQTQNSLLEFAYDAKLVHVELINGNPWFLAVDICENLGLSNVTESLRSLDEDEKLTSEILRAGQKRKANFVNESGFYALCFRSNKPEARKFRKWVTSEVLPSIRRTGGYNRKYCRTECYTKDGYIAKGFYNSYNFIDYRNVLIGYTNINNSECTILEYKGETWISLRDFLGAIDNRTSTKNWASSLNAGGKNLAKMFWIFGGTTPSYFTTANGLALIKMVSRKSRHNAIDVEIPFPVTLPKFLPAAAVEEKSNLKAV